MSASFAKHWTLDPDVVFLNHGSFGACPNPVLELQQKLRAELESQPVRFLWRELASRLEQAREALGQFINAPGEDLALITNATAGVNTVLRSLDFNPGDELIVTDHEYNACRNALDYVARRRGATVVVVPIPLPVESPQQITRLILDRVTTRTRLAMIDHVTSPTALVFPIADIVAELAQRGVDTLVDGAHAPGMVDVNIHTMQPAYYTGNCHKWICAPKGAAFLYVRPDRQESVRPLSISHGANAPLEDKTRFRHEFDWTGTTDPTPWLCIPKAIEFMGSLFPDGWPPLRDHNRELALGARRLLCDAMNTPPICPDEMIGSMAAVFLPDAISLDGLSPLYEKTGIEVPIYPVLDGDRRVVRVSAQIYNHLDQYRFLVTALQDR